MMELLSETLRLENNKSVTVKREVSEWNWDYLKMWGYAWFKVI